MINLNKNNSWLFVGVLLICFSVSVIVRFKQYETWEKTPTFYFVGERPLMTTLDAPFWLLEARKYNKMNFAGAPVNINDSGKDEHFNRETSIPENFLDDSHSISTSLERSYKDVPLLSFLIAHLTPYFNHNYYLTGTILVPILASLFIIPIGFYLF